VAAVSSSIEVPQKTALF